MHPATSAPTATTTGGASGGATARTTGGTTATTTAQFKKLLIVPSPLAMRIPSFRGTTPRQIEGVATSTRTPCGEKRVVEKPECVGKFPPPRRKATHSHRTSSPHGDFSSSRRKDAAFARARRRGGPLSLAPPAALPLPIQNLVGTSGEEVSCPAFATSRVCASLGARESWRLRDALSPRARHTRLFRDFQRGHTHAHLHTRPILPGHVCVVCASLSKVFAPVSSTSSVFFQTHAAEEYAAARR